MRAAIMKIRSIALLLAIATIFLLGTASLPGQVIAAASTVGAGCGAGPAAPQFVTGRPVIGQSVVGHLSHVTPGTTALIALSAPPAATKDIGGGCLAYVNVYGFSLSAPFPVSADGTAVISAPVNVPVSWAGVELRLQGVILPSASDTSILEVTNGVHWVFGF